MSSLSRSASKVVCLPLCSGEGDSSMLHRLSRLRATSGINSLVAGGSGQPTLPLHVRTAPIHRLCFG
jgi:hypothetical protein